ncbi:MAG: thioredoxin domain-containing protein [Sphingobacteriales bacterium]|nr:thioredoxin domain-containing protein [Sphingobacteriales bacterium]
MHKYANRLINESSPYLKQHAHNPVDWYPWGDEALNRAKEEDKLILVSIGYAACHWCHVMEKESFEQEDVAEIMNRYFINIKIDREERPDIDHIYMDAVQAMTGSGGWPLNVFLTPDKQPFYGGTYFPPVKAFNRPSWKDVLYGVAQAYKERKQEIISQAENLTEHLKTSNSFGQIKKAFITEEENFSEPQLHLTYENLMKNADVEEGGFGKAPKFPQTFSISLLLKYYHFFKKDDALKQACLSLNKMIFGGIYDQLGGGLARYSTDSEWLVPHFEKMLYDNALLVDVLSDAFQLTKDPEYHRVIDEIIEFIQRELMNEEKLFLSALDADSEGEEGLFYVWSKHELEKILGEDALLFCTFYDVTEGGNWEEKNILRIKTPLKEFALLNNLEINQLTEQLKFCKQKILLQRNKRTRPATDDKVLLGWNALMNIALSKAFSATGNTKYRQLACENMKIILKKFRQNDGSFLHTYKNDFAKYPAFLDDYAYVIQALIKLQEITSDGNWLHIAKQLTEFVKDNFEDSDTGFFYFTNQSQKDLIIRKKEIYDGATPSGNAIMALNLHQLSIIFNQPKWKEQAVNNLLTLLPAIIRHPGSFGVWGSLLIDLVIGVNEIAIVGNNFPVLRDAFLSHYCPNKILQSALIGSKDFPLLSKKETGTETLLYLCRNYACHQPVSTVNSLIELLVKTQAPKHNK